MVVCASGRITATLPARASTHECGERRVRDGSNRSRARSRTGATQPRSDSARRRGTITARSSANGRRGLRREPVEARDGPAGDVRARGLGLRLESRQRRQNMRGLVMRCLVQRHRDRAWTVVGWIVGARVIVRLRAIVMTDERRGVTKLARVRIENVRDLRLVTPAEHTCGDEPEACNRCKRPSSARSAPRLLQTGCK